MSQLILNIDNQELEDTLKDFAKKHKKALEQVAIDAIKQFIGLTYKNKIEYQKKDVTKHMHVIKKEFDEELCDDKALQDIEDSASYIHDLRRQK